MHIMEPPQIVGRATANLHRQLVQPLPTSAGHRPSRDSTATANLCRSQNIQRQLVQPLPTSAGHRTSKDSWYSHCQPPQIVGTVSQLRTELLIRLNHTSIRASDPFTRGWQHFPFWNSCVVCGTVDND